MKTKNPLYVIKGKDVEAVSSFFDLFVKKFNLEGVLNILKNIFQMLLDSVQNFAMFVAVKSFIDEVFQRINKLITI